MLAKVQMGAAHPQYLAFEIFDAKHHGTIYHRMLRSIEPILIFEDVLHTPIVFKMDAIGKNAFSITVLC